jgi:hypothetical protein
MATRIRKATNTGRCSYCNKQVTSPVLDKGMKIHISCNPYGGFNYSFDPQKFTTHHTVSIVPNSIKFGWEGEDAKKDC